jgi:hypothetical protein
LRSLPGRAIVISCIRRTWTGLPSLSRVVSGDDERGTAWSACSAGRCFTLCPGRSVRWRNTNEDATDSRAGLLCYSSVFLGSFPPYVDVRVFISSTPTRAGYRLTFLRKDTDEKDSSATVNFVRTLVSPLDMSVAPGTQECRPHIRHAILDAPGEFNSGSARVWRSAIRRCSLVWLKVKPCARCGENSRTSVRQGCTPPANVL